MLGSRRLLEVDALVQPPNFDHVFQASIAVQISMMLQLSSVTRRYTLSQVTGVRCCMSRSDQM